MVVSICILGGLLAFACVIAFVAINDAVNQAARADAGEKNGSHWLTIDRDNIKLQLVERESEVAALKDAASRKDKEILRLNGHWDSIVFAHAQLDKALREK